MSYNRNKPFTYTGKTRAGIFKSDRPGWVKVVTPYNPKFVDEIKQTIQPSSRSYVPSEKVWLVNDMFLAEIVDMVRKYFDEFDTDLREDEPVPQIAAPDNVWVLVFEAVPETARKTVYRALANAIHPDKGGSEDQMKLLNAAYKEIEEK